VTLKVTQGHLHWCRLTAHVWLPVSLQCNWHNFVSVLYRFQDGVTYLSKFKDVTWPKTPRVWVIRHS